MGQGMEDDGKRRFVKKWNMFIEDFCYKELGAEDLNIMEPEDFMLLKLTETDDIIVVNEGELPPQGYAMGNDGRARRTF